MDYFYRHHIIGVRGGLNPETGRWTPEFTVSWKQDSTTMTREHSLNTSFSTEQEAEQHALQFAKKWVDDGKEEPSASPGFMVQLMAFFRIIRSFGASIK